jgi:ABC-type glycerol-3-phosphate transport system permease component
VLNRIPKEIDEAAAIDGAGILMTLWRIIGPFSALVGEWLGERQRR